jgi:translation initiation factor 1
MSDSRLVYSTESGRICKKCGQPQSQCACKKSRSKIKKRVVNDGIIRIRREVKGRKGKTVTTVVGFKENGAKLKKIASELKNRCGAGGSVKDDVIIIQGDHRERLMAELKNKGFKVKLSCS